MSDLDLVSTDDLIDELGKRFDNAAFVGQVQRTDDGGNVYFRFYGDPFCLVGLFHAAAHDLTHTECKGE